MRVSSPGGRFDAVMIREGYGGAAGGFEEYVYIVLKGQPVPTDPTHRIFQAGTLRGERLVWANIRLLEIHYDIAYIEQFRNLWSLNEVQRVGSTGEGDFNVKIRLAPSSPTFSYLTPDGGFRHGE